MKSECRIPSHQISHHAIMPLIIRWRMRNGDFLHFELLDRFGLEAYFFDEIGLQVVLLSQRVIGISRVFALHLLQTIATVGDLLLFSSNLLRRNSSHLLWEGGLEEDGEAMKDVRFGLK